MGMLNTVVEDGRFTGLGPTPLESAKRANLYEAFTMLAYKNDCQRVQNNYIENVKR